MFNQKCISYFRVLSALRIPLSQELFISGQELPLQTVRRWGICDWSYAWTHLWKSAFIWLQHIYRIGYTILLIGTTDTYGQ